MPDQIACEKQNQIKYTKVSINFKQMVAATVM